MQSKPWQLANHAEQKRIERAFAKRGIAVGAPGFYDDPAFLAAESADPRILELYARYVEGRMYDDAYLSSAAEKIQFAAGVLERAIVEDGRLGACVDASGMLGRILDRLGVWNYVAKATLTIDFPEASGLSRQHFWVLDSGEFAAAHAFVVAPPFGIVDITVRHQDYSDRRRANYLPSIILASEWRSASWTGEDLANAEIREELRSQGIAFDRFLKLRFAGMIEVMGALRPRLIKINGTTLKYVITAVGGTIEPLEGITGYRPCGRTAHEIFVRDIQPRFAAN